MLKLLFSFVLIVSATTPAFAQALPFVKAPVGQEALAQAIESGNLSVLNISPKEYVEAVNLAFGLELKDSRALAAYVRQLKRVTCPTGYQSTLGRVLANGTIDLYDFKRKFVDGEECLLDTNTAQYVVSLLCGNVITATDLPIFGAVAPEPAKPVGTPGGFSFKDHIIRDSDQPSDGARAGSPNWFSRNKKRIVKVGIGTALVAGAVALFKGLAKQEQIVTINIGG